MRILHVAPFNTAGVPMSFVHAERKLGHESNLITLGRSPQYREEDICLNLPFLDFWGTRWIKRLVTPKARREVTNVTQIPEKIPIEWKPGGHFEWLLILFREWIWDRKIKSTISHNYFWDYDVYQLDGGLEFYRDGRIIRRLKERGKKIICCYTGSDLRTRGVIPEIDRMSDLNITVEFDHLQYHTDIHHVPFPLDVSQFKIKDTRECGPVRIGHAPTHRRAKGSDVIIRSVRKLEETYPAELILIEGIPYQKAIEVKHTCDIFIDQIGDLGYGMSGIEALAMGIPTCSSLAPGFSEAYPDHPFMEVNADSLEEVLIKLIQNRKLREEKGRKGRIWVQRIHEATAVVERIHRLAGIV